MKRVLHYRCGYFGCETQPSATGESSFQTRFRHTFVVQLHKEMLASFRIGRLFRFHRGVRYGVVGFALGYGSASSAHSANQRKFPLQVSSCVCSGRWTKGIKGLPTGVYSYEGETLDGEMHGQGKLTTPEGVIFNGTFEHGVIVSGKMEPYTKSIKLYEGTFANWSPHGVGKLYNKENWCFICTFHHGEVDQHNVTIRPPSGKLILEMNCYFPWLNYTYTITCPGEYKLTGTFSGKPLRGTKTYLLGDVESESGPFLEYFSFLGHRLVLHGEGTRYYRDGTVERGRFILGVLHTDKFDSEVRIAARLLDKALMRFVLWKWD